MPTLNHPLQLACAVLALLISAQAVCVADYTATPLPTAVKNHELIIVGRIATRAEGRVTVSVVQTLKGKKPTKPVSLADTWRPNAKWVFSPVPLVKGRTYLLMLHRQKKQPGYELSRDSAADAVTLLKKPSAPIVEYVKTLTALETELDTKRRRALLEDAWEREGDAGRLLLIKTFLHGKDDAGVPLLLAALKQNNYDISEHAHIIIGRHGHTQAVPVLIQLLKTKKSPLAARTLGELKAKSAYDALFAAAQDDKFPTNRYWVVQALGRLEDKRSVPLLLERLKAGLPHTRQWSLEQEYAIEPLGRMRVDEAVDPLLTLLKHNLGGNYLRRMKLVEALGRIGAPAAKALPTLEKIAPDPPAVRAIESIRADLAARQKKGR